MPACEELGRLASSGGLSGGEVSRALAALRAGCEERGVGAVCRIQGMVFQARPGADGKAGAIQALFERACAGGDGEGCYRLGKLVPQKAMELFDKGCRARHGPSCLELVVDP